MKVKSTGTKSSIEWPDARAYLKSCSRFRFNIGRLSLFLPSRRAQEYDRTHKSSALTLARAITHRRPIGARTFANPSCQKRARAPASCSGLLEYSKVIFLLTSKAPVARVRLLLSFINFHFISQFGKTYFSDTRQMATDLLMGYWITQHIHSLLFLFLLKLEKFKLFK